MIFEIASQAAAAAATPEAQKAYVYTQEHPLFCRMHA